MSASTTADAVRWAGHRTERVACPQCHSTASRCHRPSGHDATQWHLDREDAQAHACGCAGCRNWLQLRSQG